MTEPLTQIPNPNTLPDPFTLSPSNQSTRYTPLDTSNLENLVTSTTSPTQSLRALRAHLKDTDKRIQDASRLGTTLLQQRKDLAARVEEVEALREEDEIPEELRRRLVEVEREYREVGKESARAFLPRARGAETPSTASGVGGGAGAGAAAFAGSGRESPTKSVVAPSRRQRNQNSAHRVHDIEFATEISTSLLSQVRQLQAALGAKDEELRDVTAGKARVENDVVAISQKLKHLDDNEQKYKDENWNLETRLQELEGSHKAVSDREIRANQHLKASQAETEAQRRELDDLRVEHENLRDETAGSKRQQEADLHSLRRDVASHESLNENLQKRVEDLTAQNSELAKAVSYRWNNASNSTNSLTATSETNSHDRDASLPDDAFGPPESPVKGTPRPGMLESETLKSSLNHAHRMIQNLKNNIHREKTEKVELKRMLQDARDELETARRGSEGGTAAVSANVGKKRRSDLENGGLKFRKPQRGLGVARNSTTEVLDGGDDDVDWEDHDGDALGAGTPSRSMNLPGSFAGISASEAEAAETTDAAFETATERGTASDAFETGHEGLGDESDELTETETTTTAGVGGTVQAGRIASFSSASARERERGTAGGGKGKYHAHRQSFQSTASLSDYEKENFDIANSPAASTRGASNPVSTPVSAAQGPKYRLRFPRGKRDRISALVSDSPRGSSPASSSGTPVPLAGQSLGDELDGLDYEDEGGSVGGWSREGTPGPAVDSAAGTPMAGRGVDMLAVEPLAVEPLAVEPLAVEPSAEADGSLVRSEQSGGLRPVYADVGVMTEDWVPEKVDSAEGIGGQRAGIFGAALAGLGLGGLVGSRNDVETANDDVDAGTDAEEAEVPAADRSADAMAAHMRSPSALGLSTAMSQDTVPIIPTQIGQKYRDAVVSDVPTDFPQSVRGHFDFSPVATQAIEPLTPMPLYESVKPSANGGVNGTTAGVIAGTAVVAGFGAGTMLNYRSLLGDLPPITARNSDPTSEGLFSDALSPPLAPNPVKDESSQTLLSSLEIADLLNKQDIRPKLSSAAMAAVADLAPTTPTKPSTSTRTVTPPGSRPRSIEALTVADEAAPLKTARRVSSSSSMRNRDAMAEAPPLPVDHTRKIAIAAAQRSSTYAPLSAPTALAPTPATPGTAAVGTMGPPLMPASAYKQKIPITSTDPVRMSPSKDGNTSRTRQAQQRQTSSRNSISSFASEVDDRLNAKTQFLYPEGVKPSTDPRMIQAITQTMIGEFLWKYTRKTWQSDISATRHRRFFWVHPYTRTLYWSEKDPSTAGREMLKAKSVAIDAVRVVSDDNAYPPGLHRKSLVVVTPGREIVFTAPTGQRHETWFNALSYLLLRTEAEKSAALAGTLEGGEIDEADLNEFRAGAGAGAGTAAGVGRGVSVRQSLRSLTDRHGGNSRVSLSSYNSRTSRNSSVQRSQQREIVAAAATPTLAGTATSRSAAALPTSSSGRFSSITSRLTGGQGKTYTSARGRTAPMLAQSTRGRQAAAAAGDGLGEGESGIYDASVAAESAEDLRKVIERQEKDADRLENVRACCDGRHDVGSLSRTGRMSGMGRFSIQGHGHGHSHAHP